MNKFILLLTIIFPVLIHPMASGPESNYTSADDLAKETFGAAIFSTDLPPLSKEYCDHIISCAPEPLQKHARLLRNPKTRAALMPDTIVMLGSTGSGKSTLGRVILQESGAPFLIIKAAMLGNEFANSRAAGIKRVSQMIREMRNCNLMIDEVDRLATKKKSQNGKERESEDDAPEALWQLLDDMERTRRLFIGTSNCLENMPTQLQGRFETHLYDVPVILNLPTITTKIVKFHLSGKKIESDKIVSELCKKVNGFSNRQIGKIIGYSYLLALERDENSPIITQKDIVASLTKLAQDRKILAKTRWDKKEVFNYTVQTIGAIANLASIANMFLSLSNTFHSLRLQEDGLHLQGNALEAQKHALALQEKSLKIQDDALWYQKWTNFLGIVYATVEANKDSIVPASKAVGQAAIIMHHSNVSAGLNFLAYSSVKSFTNWIDKKYNGTKSNQ